MLILQMAWDFDGTDWTIDNYDEDRYIGGEDYVASTNDDSEHYFEY